MFLKKPFLQPYDFLKSLDANTRFYEALGLHQCTTYAE